MINNILKTRRRQNIQLLSEELFSPKSFQDRYQGLYSMASVAKYLLPVLSVVTGCYFLHYYLQLPTWLSFVAGLLLLAGYELLKLQVLKAGFVSHYNKERLSTILLLIGFGLCVGSAYLSVQGAKEYYLQHDLRGQEVSQVYSQQIDSIQNRVHFLEKHKEERWAGLLTKSERRMIEAHQQEISTLKEKQRAEEQAILARSQFDAIRVSAMVAVVELLILLCNWFYVYYLFICKIETELLEDNRPEKNSERVRPGKVVSLHVKDREEAIKQAIQSGIKDTRQLCRQFGLNVNQVNKYKRIYA